MNNNDKTTRSNMRYFLACRTKVTSTSRLLKRVICYTKLVFSLKWLSLSAGEISQLNTIAHISKNIWIRENGLMFRDTPRWDLSFGILKRTKFQNVMVLYLTEINLSLIWRLLYNTNYFPRIAELGEYSTSIPSTISLSGRWIFKFPKTRLSEISVYSKINKTVPP